MADLESAQRDGRQGASEIYKLRATIEELQEQMETLKRENKNITGNIEKFSLPLQTKSVYFFAHEINWLKIIYKILIHVDEIRELTEQLGEGGRSVHDLEKMNKKLELEKVELQNALEEAECALEQEEAKVFIIS